MVQILCTGLFSSGREIGRALFSIFDSKKRLPKKHHFFNEFSLHFLTPFWLQNGPRITPKSIKNAS